MESRPLRIWFKLPVPIRGIVNLLWRASVFDQNYSKYYNPTPEALGYLKSNLGCAKLVFIKNYEADVCWVVDDNRVFGLEF